MSFQQPRGEHVDSQQTGPERSEADELPPPTGTLFLMMLYIMILGGMWGAIYFEFIGR
jgi:hypothetical protein